MTKCFFILFIAALTVPLFAQDPAFKISGKVMDGQTQQPLANVGVQINGTLQGVITDSNGLFELTSAENGIILTFSLMGYEKLYVKLNEPSAKPLIITLSRRTEMLKEVVISSSPIETVMKGKQSNVLDYSFYGDNILLITFTSLSKSTLLLLSPGLDTISKMSIPDKPSGLFKDCLGNNHILCSRNVYQVFFDSVRLQLLPPSGIETFEALLYPCIAEDSENLYFMKKHGSHQIDMERFRLQTNNHALDYYHINKSSKERRSLVSIADLKTMELSAQEDQYLDQKDALGMYRKPILKEFDRIFAETILYKEIYAPLFRIGGSIYIFDYINSRIRCYSSGKLSNELEIRFHEDKSWKREMCVDQKANRAYAIYESDGITTLKEIDLKSGLLKDSYMIPFHFIESIKAHDDYIYFLYKGKEYEDTRFLSRLRAH